LVQGSSSIDFLAEDALAAFGKKKKGGGSAGRIDKKGQEGCEEPWKCLEAGKKGRSGKEKNRFQQAARGEDQKRGNHRGVGDGRSYEEKPTISFEKEKRGGSKGGVPKKKKGAKQHGGGIKRECLGAAGNGLKEKPKERRIWGWRADAGQPAAITFFGGVPISERIRWGKLCQKGAEGLAPQRQRVEAFERRSFRGKKRSSFSRKG